MNQEEEPKSAEPKILDYFHPAERPINSFWRLSSFAAGFFVSALVVLSIGSVFVQIVLSIDLLSLRLRMGISAIACGICFVKSVRSWDRFTKAQRKLPTAVRRQSLKFYQLGASAGVSVISFLGTIGFGIGSIF